MKKIISSLMVAVFMFSMIGCGDSEEVKIKKLMNSPLVIEINDEVDLKMLIKEEQLSNEKNKELIDQLKKGTAKVDTSRLGEKELVIEYQNSKQEAKEIIIPIKVVDTVAPVVEITSLNDKVVITPEEALTNEVIIEQLGLVVEDQTKVDYEVKEIDKINLKVEGEHEVELIIKDEGSNETIVPFNLFVKNNYQLVIPAIDVGGNHISDHWGVNVKEVQLTIHPKFLFKYDMNHFNSNGEFKDILSGLDAKGDSIRYNEQVPFYLNIHYLIAYGVDGYCDAECESKIQPVNINISSNDSFKLPDREFVIFNHSNKDHTGDLSLYPQSDGKDAGVMLFQTYINSDIYKDYESLYVNLMESVIPTIKVVKK